MSFKKIFLIFAILFILSESFYFRQVQAYRGANLYDSGRQAARRGDYDFAFMYFQEFLRRKPQSKSAQDAFFSLGEYYFKIKDYADSSKIFIRFIRQHPQSKAKIFALAYLLEISRLREDSFAVTAFEKEIAISKQLNLLFSDCKKSFYKSALMEDYKALFYIDKIQIYINGELFTQVSY
ncbi:MAG: outer membrane protein assembly factor BamD [Candidatus Omnitrophica bacterium]|nr:outer membrane protein assembly factor BamD [Candidatus Omnitrophota bacterium]MDD5429636.1 outer membrane protein assembly factor BamD [Candidatus Omnitrophota bacterium]